MDLETIEKELTKLLKKAEKKNEVPVAAIIVKDNKIISKAHNKVNKKNDILNHAEIISVKKATQKLKNWRLNECKMYISLEPCSMCREIIKKSRISEVYYFSKQNNEKTESDPKYEYLNTNDDFSNIISLFFKKRR